MATPMGTRPDEVSGSRPRGGRGRLLRTLTLTALCAGCVAASATADGLVPNPANHRSLIDKPIEDSRYDDARRRAVDWRLDAGVARERRSAMRLIRTLVSRDRNGNPTALARRAGVQGLIFDCKAWWAGMDRLSRYSYCYKRNGELRNDLDRTQAHRDHVHIELNWPGSRKRTGFWRSPVSRRELAR
jgi:hypothetical protein